MAVIPMTSSVGNVVYCLHTVKTDTRIGVCVFLCFSFFHVVKDVNCCAFILKEANLGVLGADSVR